MGHYFLLFGTLLIGIFFNTYLYGIVTYQFVSYWGAGFDDPIFLRCMVWFLFALDTGHSAGAIYLAWDYLVEGHGNIAITPICLLWPYPFIPIGTACAALVTQAFLGWRIFRLSEKKYLFNVIIVMSIPTFVLGMVCGLGPWISGRTMVSRINKLMINWLSLQVGVDMFVTVTLATILLRSKTGRSKTDSILRRIARGAIQTGLFAGIFSLAALVSFMHPRRNNFYAMFAIPIGRIYSNTLLDTLLVRENLRKQLSSSSTFQRSSKLMAWVVSQLQSQKSVTPGNNTGTHEKPQETTNSQPFEPETFMA